MKGAPQGSIQHNCKTGWIQKDIFVAWLRHFIKHTGSTTDNPSLIILDGHSTHVKSLELIDLARSSGVTIVCLPPHCTHRMQPLDVSFMRPLSNALGKSAKRFLTANPGLTIGLYRIAEIFGSAYEEVAIPSVLISGFKKCGLFPLDESVYEGCFGAAAVTDITEEESALDTSSQSCPQVSTEHQ